MAMYYNGKKVRNLYFNGKCITRLALGKEMTRLVEGDDFVSAQWLVGDESAYMFIGEYSNRVKFKVKLTSPSASLGFVYGHNGALRIYRSANIFTTVIPENRISNVQLPSTKEILIDFSEHLVYADDAQMAYTNKGSEDNDESAFKKAYFFGTESLSSYRSDCSIGTIYADNRVFIPCRLLRPIPAALDGNGIARSAGECGMYDSISGKFYGNVASSGAFTVEPSLVEGVDYERHRWLDFVYEGTQSIRFMALPINSDIVSFQRVYVEYTNNSIFQTGGSRYSYGLSSSNQLIRIWDYNENTSVYAKTAATESTLRSIQSTSTSLLINEVEIPKYGFPIGSVVWFCTQSLSCRNSSITVDGIERYIPVRLLRPLASYLDANGKARSQFECGMLDLKTMKFYGNVATTGNFTVSDN